MLFLLVLHQSVVGSGWTVRGMTAQENAEYKENQEFIDKAKKFFIRKSFDVRRLGCPSIAGARSLFDPVRSRIEGLKLRGLLDDFFFYRDDGFPAVISTIDNCDIFVEILQHINFDKYLLFVDENGSNILHFLVLKYLQAITNRQKKILLEALDRIFVQSKEQGRAESFRSLVIASNAFGITPLDLASSNPEIFQILNEQIQR